MVLIVLPSLFSDFAVSSRSCDTSPSTFSRINPSIELRWSDNIRCISKNRVPLVSANPFCNPALLNAWQGNPPSRTLNWGMSELFVLVISVIFMFSPGKLVFRARIADGFISEVNTHLPSIPRESNACSNPIRIPPNPANRSMKVHARFLAAFFRSFLRGHSNGMACYGNEEQTCVSSASMPVKA